MANDIQNNYLQVINKYAVFDGRAGRQEYWTFILANLIVSIALAVGTTTLAALTAIDLTWIAALYSLAVLCPAIGVSIRRLHDIDRSGWWVLLGFVPVVGSIALIVLHCLPGTEGENQFGSQPKGIGMDPDNPERMAQQAERELESNLKKLKESVVESVATEKQIEGQIKAKKEEHETWSNRASMAVQANNDSVARECLGKKGEVNQVLQGLTEQLRCQKEATATLKARYAEAEQQLRDFSIKKSHLAARDKASQAKLDSETAAEAGSKSESALDRWEEKIRRQEALTEAKKELSGQFAQEEQLKQITKTSDLEDELAALKRKVSGNK